MDKAQLTRELRAQARGLGADAFGLAPAVPPPTTQGGPQAYEDWLRAGMQGGMDYMTGERSDMLRWFPEARSVAVAAFNYHDGSPAPAPDPGAGRLARYALPPDYHDELKRRMEGLRDWYQARTGGKGVVFADSSPVLERLYARHAGIGWVGKNTMILSRRLGSFFLLAGLALDRELEHDEPVPDHCGTCNRCLEACPTDAFPGPRRLDASRCVAYFTVEARKEPVPEGFREGIGDWLFGCDACQDICPWNRFSARKLFSSRAVPETLTAEGAARRPFSSRSSSLEPALPPAFDLEALAGMSEPIFRRRFRGTPLFRTGRRALVRNALLAMGNSRDPRHLPMLRRFAASDDPLLAEQARWSVNLIESFAHEQDVAGGTPAGLGRSRPGPGEGRPS